MSEGNGSLRRHAAVVIVASMLATLFVLQAMRMSVPSTIVVLDQANRNEIVRTILLGFVLILGGGLWRRVFGVWRGAGVALGLLTGARVAMQVASDRPEALIWLGAAVVACWGWATLALLVGSRSAAGFGIVLAFVADIALRSVLWSVDLGWMSTGPRLAVMLALAAVALVAAALLVRTTNAPESAELSGLPLLAIGPALGIYLAYGGSFGVAASVRDGGYAEVVGYLSAVGFGTVAWVYQRNRRPGGRVAGWPLTVGAIVVMAVASVVPGLSLLGCAVLLLFACFGERTPRWRFERLTTTWFTLGMTLQILLLAQFYTWTADPAFLIPLALLAAVGAVGAGRIRREGAGQAWERLALPSLIATGLVIALSWGWVSVAIEDAPAPTALPADFTVMTWNLQTGFALDNHFDLEAQARAIEAADPDVLLLQEVTRGWAVSGSVDQVTWLGRRLGMRVYFGAVSGDGSWGNAILTNAPVRSATAVQFTTTVNFDRGAVKVVIANGDADVTVIATHLDDGPAGAAVLETQVAELLSFWGGAPRTIIGGDINTTPGTPPIVQVTDAGFLDTGAAFGAEVETYVDEGRIDYLFVTPDLAAGDAVLGAGWESDHRSLLSTMAVR